jgi:cytochrome P450
MPSAPTIPEEQEPMVHYDPYDHAIHDDPYPVYRRLRDEAPLYYAEPYNVWVLSRYEDCSRALRDFKTFSNGRGTSVDVSKEQMPTVLDSDPPNHTRLRHLMSGMFTPEAVQPLEQVVRTMALDLLEPHLGSGRIDIIGDFAARLPMAIICQLLGFPREDEDMVRLWTDTVLRRDEATTEMPPHAIEATLKLFDYFERLMAERARHPERDDLVAHLMRSEQAGKLSHQEVLGYLYILSIAGNETTTKLIGNVTYQLHRHPDQRALLLAEPALLPLAIEETLRFDGPTQQMARTVARDVELHGRTLRDGDRITMLFISANRDERHYANAETFDIRRDPRDHLAFGGGLHSCLGAALARLEARIAMQEILRLMPDFAVEEEGLARMHSPAVRGYTHVPVRFTATSAAH